MSDPVRPDPTSPLRQPDGQSVPDPFLGDADDLLMKGHKYDGIREYDNPMPGWWTGIFLITIVFAPIYLLGIHVFDWFDTYEENLAESQAELLALREAYAASGAGLATTPAALLEYAEDPTFVAAGAPVYATNCAACHGAQGEGLIGPNLADEFWVHGGSPADIWEILEVGVPEAGMPPWESVLSAEERAGLMAYVLSLGGTNPPNPKAPEGEPYLGS
jgi:cytochrome c oxidase cbb3-type subunit 3